VTRFWCPQLHLHASIFARQTHANGYWKTNLSIILVVTRQLGASWTTLWPWAHPQQQQQLWQQMVHIVWEQAFLMCWPSVSQRVWHHPQRRWTQKAMHAQTKSCLMKQPWGPQHAPLATCLLLAFTLGNFQAKTKPRGVPLGCFKVYTLGFSSVLVNMLESIFHGAFFYGNCPSSLCMHHSFKAKHLGQVAKPNVSK
jgi:hypothetical protein